MIDKHCKTKIVTFRFSCIVVFAIKVDSMYKPMYKVNLGEINMFVMFKYYDFLINRFVNSDN